MSDRTSRIDGESYFGLVPGGAKRITIAAAAVAPRTFASPYQMKPDEPVIIAITAQADAAARVTLPSLAEGAGKFYAITAPTASTAGDISVYEKETGAELSTYGDLDADGDFLLVYSDGTAWRVIASVLG